MRWCNICMTAISAQCKHIGMSSIEYKKAEERNMDDDKDLLDAKLKGGNSAKVLMGIGATCSDVSLSETAEVIYHQGFDDCLQFYHNLKNEVEMREDLLRKEISRLKDFIKRTEGYMFMACQPNRGDVFAEWDSLRSKVLEIL